MVVGKLERFFAVKLAKLRSHFPLRNAEPKHMRQHFGVVMERIVLELRGISCIPLEEMPPPKKEIEQALKYAQSKGWRIEKGGSHAWGKIYCPYNSADCRCGEFCVTSVWSTPKSAENHAKQIRRIVDNCTMLKNNKAKRNR